MTAKLRFGLNHMVCPSLTPMQVLDAAASIGIDAVELRNDVGENSITDLETAKAVGAKAKELGIEIRSINALYPFNVWNEEREAQAEKLAQLAQACGATGLVSCPLNDGSEVDRAGLEAALTGLDKVLSKYDLKGFIEPLGFPISSLRLKAEALAAIDATGTADRFSLVHDTFHHRGAGETGLFPARTGLVHVSGLEDSEITFNDMLDGHRVFVGPNDRLGNVDQLKALLEQGYDDLVSFEPFAEEVWNLEDPIAALKESMDYIQASLNA